MCLLKSEQHDTNCGHEECKSFYMLNKPRCVFNLGPFQSQSTPDGTIITAQPQKQIFLTQPQINQVGNTQGKRTLKADPDLLNILKKKVKNDSNSSNPIPYSSIEEQNQSETAQSLTDQSKNLQDYGYVQAQIMSQANGDRNIFNSTILNNILVPNSNQANNYPNSTYVFPLLQNNQQGMQQPIIVPTPNNQINPISVNQVFNQGIKKTTNTPQTPVNTISVQQEIKPKNDMNPASEAFMKEFQTRILGLLFTQNKMLVELKDKNEILQDTLAALINEINSLKGSIKQNTVEKVSTIPSTSMLTHQIIGNSAETVTVDNLLTYLYGANADFPYQLILKSDIALPLYRERNFKFTVLLADKKGNPIENHSRIPLTIGIYSSENPPKYIDSNTAGNKILKGFIEKDLVNGSVTFEKIQIKEVTSHFRNGWVFFVVYPKINNAGSASQNSGNGITGNKIKPLILEKVIVKAKKAKEKETNENQDDDKNDRDGGDNDNDSPTDKKKVNSPGKEESVYM